MYTYIIESFTASKNHVEELWATIVDYEKFLISEGFLGRGSRIVLESKDDGLIRVGGVLSDAVFPPGKQEVVGPPTDLHSRLQEKRDKLRRLSDKIEVEYSNVTYSADEHYCNHSRCEAIVLAPNRPWGLSPIVCCECGGSVARYRLPVSEDLAGDIWSYDLQSECIETCWTISAELEAWADGERYHAKSRLNELGRSIAARIRAELGIDAWLYIPPRENIVEEICPNCEDAMQQVDSIAWWTHQCSSCRIVS